MWRHLWPGSPARPVGSVTNGVHTQSWIGPEMRALYAQHLGADWEDRLLDARRYWKRARRDPRRGAVGAHRAQKERLIRFVRERVRTQSARHGMLARRAARASRGCSIRKPSPSASRAASPPTSARCWCSPTSTAAGARCSTSTERPVQIIFAGKAHPADRAGQDLIRRLVPADAGRVPRASSCSSRTTTSRWAACWCRAATSGSTRRAARRKPAALRRMKSPINGGVNVSILDGWWVEGYAGDNGWAIGSDANYADADAQDRDDAASLYQVLEEEVVPHVLRSRRRRPAAPVDLAHEELDRHRGTAVQRAAHGARLRPGGYLTREPSKV